MEMKDGKLVATVEESAIIEQVAATAAEEAIKDAGLTKPVVPAPVVPAPAVEDFSEKANESTMSKAMRLAKAAVAVRGGQLAIEKAPKEIKTIRFFKALMEKDETVIKALSEGSATDGGNLVPTEFGTDLIFAIEQYSLSSRCTNHVMTSNELDLRSVTTKPLVYQVGEAVAVTPAAPKFGKPVLTAKAFAGLQIMSKEVFQDNNVGLYDKLVILFAEALAAKRDYEILVGSAFTGVFGSSTPVTTTLSSNSILNIGYKDLVNAANSLTQGQLANGGEFVMHRTVWGYVQGITDLNGRPIVMNPYDARNRTLLGYPVYLTEQAPSADAANSAFIAFGNFKWVDFGTRNEISAKMLTEATVGGVNLAEQRSLGLIIDERWGLVVSQPTYLAQIKTAA